MQSTYDEENDIEEVLEPIAFPVRERKKRDPSKGPDKVGISYYGEKFTGYSLMVNYRDLIPAFKDLYYSRMIADPKARLYEIVREFNDSIESEGREFWPHTNLIRKWKKKWDMDILAKKGMMVEEIKTRKNVQQVLKTRNSGDDGLVQYATPTYEDMEAGLQTLGGELMNDAIQMLRDDQALEDIYDSDELIKRKTYVVNVFGHVTKMVHGKASLLLKMSQEKRENAGFLMELMKKATSGKMSSEEIAALKGDYQPTAPAEFS